MAKIANVQLPTNQNVQLPVQMAKDVKDAKGTDDFVNLLQQKSEATKQPDKSEVTDSKQPEAKPDTKEVSDQTDAKEEEVSDNLLEQTALEQLAAQMSVISSQWQTEAPAEPAAAEVLAEPVLTEAVEALGEPVLTSAVQENAGGLQEAVLTEAVAESQPEIVPEIPVEATNHKEQKGPKEPAKTPSAHETVKTPEAHETVKTPEAHEEQTPVRTEHPQNLETQTKEEPKGSLMEESDSQTASAEGQQILTSETIQQPVNQTEPAFQAEKTETTTELKTTPEELPQELGKALSSGKMTGTRTLTVELEPASLGKLTIKVSYEAGRTAVSILASNPKSLEILNQKATEIAAILKERTGEETVIYTQEPQPQEEDSYDGHQGGQSQEREEHSRRDEGKEQQTESFAQQLRLGLV